MTEETRLPNDGEAAGKEFSLMKEVQIETLALNPFQKIGKEWMLVAAGTPERCNAMTASWGGMGVMWGQERRRVRDPPAAPHARFPRPERNLYLELF